MSTTFNKQKEYEDLVREKVNDLKKLCHIQRMPMFITICTKNDDKETVYEKEMVSAATCGHELFDNQIAKHVNVSLGFDTVQPSSEVTLEMDDMDVNYIKEEEAENDDE